MKKLIYSIITCLILLTSFSPVLAETSQADINKVLNDIETERIKKLEAQLALTLPLITDNPNHIFSFSDPSGKGVKLEIDGQGYKQIKSPYTLPALGIGKHVLTFKFTDNQDTEQTLEKFITVVPRPPIIQAPEKMTNNEISIKGTALADSQVELYMSSQTKSYNATATVATDGTWSYTFKEKFDFGIYNIIAITAKTGIKSSFSEPIVFEISSGKNNNTQEVKRPIYFTFQDFFSSDIIKNIQDNPQIDILAVASLLLGIIAASIAHTLRNRKRNQKLESIFSSLLNKKDEEKVQKKNTQKEEIVAAETSAKTMTIREKLERAKKLNTPEAAEVQENKEEEKKEVVEEKKEEVKDKKKKREDKKVKSEEVQEEKPEETKVVDKEEFMKEFKEQDPDDNKGVEKENNEIKSEKENKGWDLAKKLKISLTSKAK